MRSRALQRTRAWGAVTALVVAVPVYRWVDEAGRVHYSERVPPTAREIQTAELLTTPSIAETQAARERLARLEAELAAAQERRATAQEQVRIERELAEARRQENLRRCTLAQRNRYTLARGRPVYTVDDKGQRIFLDGRAWEVEVQRLEAEIMEYCE